MHLLLSLCSLCAGRSSAPPAQERKNRLSLLDASITFISSPREVPCCCQLTRHLPVFCGLFSIFSWPLLSLFMTPYHLWPQLERSWCSTEVRSKGTQIGAGTMRTAWQSSATQGDRWQHNWKDSQVPAVPHEEYPGTQGSARHCHSLLCRTAPRNSLTDCKGKVILPQCNRDEQGYKEIWFIKRLTCEKLH